MLIGDLARGEDLTARWGGGRFAIVLAGSRAADAEAPVGRIRGVVNHTRFSVEDVTVPVDVRIEAGIAEAADGESGEALVRRALAGAGPTAAHAGGSSEGCDQ